MESEGEEMSMGMKGDSDGSWVRQDGAEGEARLDNDVSGMVGAEDEQVVYPGDRVGLVMEDLAGQVQGDEGMKHVEGNKDLQKVEDIDVPAASQESGFDPQSLLGPTTYPTETTLASDNPNQDADPPGSTGDAVDDSSPQAIPPTSTGALIAASVEAVDAPPIPSPIRKKRRIFSTSTTTITRRSLRPRLSEPNKPPPPSAHLDTLPPKPLTEEGIPVYKQKLLEDRQRSLDKVVEDHDTLVRELFHLDKFKLMSDYDPVEAKKDQSEVFQQFQRRFDLYANALPDDTTNNNGARMRTTRRAMNDLKSNLNIGGASTSSTNPSTSTPPSPSVGAKLQNGESASGVGKGGRGNGRGRRSTSIVEVVVPPRKGKGKQKVEEVQDEVVAIDTPPSRKGKGKQKLEAEVEVAQEEVTVGALPTYKRGSGRISRRSTGSSSLGEPSTSTLSGSGSGSGVADGEGSSSNGRVVSGSKKRRKSSLMEEIKVEESPSLVSNESKPSNPVRRGRPPKNSPSTITSVPTALPISPVKRLKLIHRSPPTARYFQHTQLPPAPRWKNGSLKDLMASYIALEEESIFNHQTSTSPTTSTSGSTSTPQGLISDIPFGRIQPILQTPQAATQSKRDFDNKVLQELSIRRRIESLQSSGASLTLKPFPKATTAADPQRSKDHMDNLVSHAVHFAKLVQDERKLHTGMARKISRMVKGYWDHLEGKEERERVEEEKRVKGLAKWIMREVKKKWKLAANVVKARRQALLKEEQDRLGKQHLNKILEQSTKLLQAQQEDLSRHDHRERSASASESSRSRSRTRSRSQSVVGNRVSRSRSGRSSRSRSVSGPAAIDADTGEEQESEEPVAGPGPMSTSRRQAKERRRGPHVNGIATGNDATDEDGQDEELRHENEDEEEREDTDRKWEEEMEAEEEGANGQGAAEDSDEEMDGLAADADIPIEELLKRYGYGDDGGGGDGHIEEEEEEGEEEEEEEEEEDVTMATADAEDEDFEDDEVLIVVTPNDIQRQQNLLAEGGDLALLNGASSPTPLVRTAVNGQPVNGDATDVEEEPGSDFESREDEEQAHDDAKFEEEMDKEEGDSDDGEMDGLAADADVPIEELLRRYGYMNRVAEDEDEVGSGEDAGEDDGLGEEPAAERSRTSPVENDAGEEPAAESSMPPDEGAGLDERTTEPITKQELDEIETTVSDADGSQAGSDETSITSEDDTGIRIPFLLRATLRPYQEAGFKWLASLYQNKQNGILADEMGLGKTIQTITLLAHLACDKGIWGPHLVIAPTSVTLNWDMEFKKFFPGFKVLSYYGNQKERKEKRIGWNTENHFHVCITSYQIVLADQHVFRRKAWQYLILDEAHHIKNFKSQRWQTLLGFNSQRRLLLTGTPLQNNLMELWSLLYFICPPTLGADGRVGPFANHREFQAWFSNPMDRAIESGTSMDDETRATVSKLHAVLRPYLLRRMKAEVEQEMPAKYEHIVYCRLSKRQRFLYDDFMSRSKTRETLASGNFLSIINCLMQLRKVCNHPDLFEVRPIVTSFAMDRSAVADYEIKDLLVRKRLLASDRFSQPDLASFRLLLTAKEETSSLISHESKILDASDLLKAIHEVPPHIDLSLPVQKDTRTVAGWKRYTEHSKHVAAVGRLERLSVVNKVRCQESPVFGRELVTALRRLGSTPYLQPRAAWRDPRFALDSMEMLPSFVKSYTERASLMEDTIARFAFATPPVIATDLPALALPAVNRQEAYTLGEEFVKPFRLPSVKLSIAFPDRSLLQYDCGKLQKLDELFRSLKPGGHRFLIFTQMTRVLDILEAFLNFHGHRYLRLDGSTKVEERQIITERFNRDSRIVAFISSTRAGGLGINLTGADTVVFYDSDWNPALDAQCQDRAHRIGQTRDVHIYRFISEHTIEENVLRKANQKRLLDNVVIGEGDFTTDHMSRVDWRDMLPDEFLLQQQQQGGKEIGVGAGVGAGSEVDVRKALAAAEDEEDAVAAQLAEKELELDKTDFIESAPVANVSSSRQSEVDNVAEKGAVSLEAVDSNGGGDGYEISGDLRTATVDDDGEGDDEDPLAGTIDGYMLKLVEAEWDYFRD